MDPLIQCAVREQAIVGESPVWSVEEQVLYWVDITGRKIHRFDPATGVNETVVLPQPVTALALRRGGGFVLTLEKDFAFFDWRSQRLELRGNPEPDLPDNRFNDAKCDRQGRFWAGTMGSTHWNEPVGSLYRFDPDGTITRMHEGVACANGLDWSPDSRVMYFTESFAYRVWAFDFDARAGAIDHPRVFAEVDRATGAFPDGLTVDAEGFVWSVHNAVGRLARYAPDGRLDRVIDMPVPRPCGCAFGGPALDTLYVTSAQETMTAEQIARYPLSGSLFSLQPGVRGLPESTFAG